MGAESADDKRTVRLDMKALYAEAVELVGQEEADRLWAENRLDSEENWPGKWAKAMEVVDDLRRSAAG